MAAGRRLLAGANPSEPKLTANQRILYRILHDAGSASLTQDEWYAQAGAEGIGAKAPARLTEARYAPVDRKLVGQYAERWFANRT